MEYRVEPEVVTVDRPAELRVAVTLDGPMSEGETIAFALPEAWSSQRCCITYTKEPQYTNPDAPDYVTVRAERARFELSLEGIPLPAGGRKGHVRKIVATLAQGHVGAGGQIVLALRNFRSTWLAEAGTLRVWRQDWEEPRPPKLRTRPAQAEHLRVIVPSWAGPGQPFRVNIVSLDPFWNRSASVYGDGVLRVDRGDVLEDHIAFTGSYTTRAVIAEPGVHRLRFGEELSNPVRITPQPNGPWWGDLHAHDKVHDCGAGEDPYTYARRTSCLDFLAVAPSYRAISPDVWRGLMHKADEADEPRRFTCFLAYEAGFRQGHYNVYFCHGRGEMFDVTDSEGRTMAEVLSGLDPHDAIAVPHHLGIDWCPHHGYPPGWDPWVPLLEIYSQHGQSEMYMPEHVLSYEFNRTRGQESKYAISVDRPVYARDAWRQGRRFGVIASSDDHMGQPGKPVKGLAAIVAPENTRTALFSSMKARRTYGTTGERILLDFRINGCQMGQEIRAGRGAHLDVSIEVHGTDEIAFVEVARLKFAEPTWEIAFSERLQDLDTFHESKTEPLLDYEAHFEDRFDGDAVYYLRMAQRRQIADWPVFAWSSPIWVVKA